MVKLAGFAKQHIFDTWFESVLDPFQSTEKHNFDGTRLIGKTCRSPLGPWGTDELYVADGTNQLVIHQIVVHLRHLMDLALVDIAERDLVEHVHVGDVNVRLKY